MNLRTAKRLAQKYGQLCKSKPNNVDINHWEALNFCRTIILQKNIRNNKNLYPQTTLNVPTNEQD